MSELPDDNEKIVLIALLTGSAVLTYANTRYNPTPYHTSSLTGRQWMQELFDGYPRHMADNLGVNPHVFSALCDALQEKGGLQSSHYVDVEEQVAMFLYLGTTNLSTRKLAEHFQRSIATVSRYTHNVLEAILAPAFLESVICLPTSMLDTPVSPIIADNLKFYPYFKNACGALDGSHVGAFAPVEDQARHRDRNGNISQNGLFRCTFEMLFHYILAGWEGSASDSHIFAQARETSLRIPEGCYLLADAGFSSCDALLVPYRGVRYYVREWAAAGARPQDFKELFNLRHAQLQNVIERIFGALKEKFLIVDIVSKYSLSTQAGLTVAYAAIFNFNRMVLGIEGQEYSGGQRQNAPEQPAMTWQ